MEFRPAKRLVVGLILVCLAVATSILHSQPTQSAALTSVSVTLSNPRLSFRGSLDASNTEGSTVVTINTGSSHPSNSTAQLLQGDSVAIGNGAGLSTYTVASSSAPSNFTITAGLGTGDADNNDDVISTQSAQLTVRFTTANAVANGRFRILVPSVSSDADAADGIPDGDAFDFGNSAPTVTCPSDVGATYDFVTGTATASTITIASTDYHAFECAYSGAGAIGTAFDAVTINSLINPAPASGHSTGTADAHNILIQHIDDTFAVQDSTTVSVGVIETVKVTATVAPTISFSIAGVASSQTKCGFSTDVTTTAAAVNFGELGLISFTDAAQTLTVSTNATGGYSVTAIANDQLGLNGAACTGDNTGSSCIRDAAGDDATMAEDAIDEFESTNTKGFAYSIDNDDAASVPFEYSTSTGNCDSVSGTPFCARQFADDEDAGDPQTPQEVMSSTTVANNENADICYRIIPDVTTAAGTYENNITYTATATF